MYFYIAKIRSKYAFYSFFAFLFSLFWTDFLGGQERVSQRKNEIAFSIDISAARPGSEWEDIVDPNLGFGLFYRTQWPAALYSEAGFLWALLGGDYTHRIRMIPFYAALGYRLPLESRLDMLMKAGLGSAYLKVEPHSLSGWDPFLLLGLELSILAARYLRIGVRLDYLYLYEKHLDPPEEIKDPPPVPSHADPRFQRAQNFRIVNGEFIRFGILLGFLF